MYTHTDVIIVLHPFFSSSSSAIWWRIMAMTDPASPGDRLDRCVSRVRKERPGEDRVPEGAWTIPFHKPRCLYVAFERRPSRCPLHHGWLSAARRFPHTHASRQFPSGEYNGETTDSLHYFWQHSRDWEENRGSPEMYERGRTKQFFMEYKRSPGKTIDEVLSQLEVERVDFYWFLIR